MNKFESASILAGISPNEEPQVSEPTNLHVITGEVVSRSEDGTVMVSMDGLVFSEDDTQYIEMDTLGGLEEGDDATIILAGENGSAMTPLAVGSQGSVDRVRETAENASQIAEAAQEVAEATNQHFWHDDSGAHVTMATQEEWEQSHSGHNSLWNALGTLFRDGLNNLLTLTTESGARALTIWDGLGNSASNILARFSSDGISFADGTSFDIGDSSSYIHFDGNGHINIGGSGLTIGGYATNADVADAINGISVGGRNLLRNTGNPTASDLAFTRATVEDGIITITPTTSAGYAKFKVDYLDFDDYGEGEYTFSFDAKAVSGATYTNLKGPVAYAGFNVASRMSNASFSSSYDRYKSWTLSPTLTYDWTRYTQTFTVPDDLTTGQASALASGSNLTVVVAMTGSYAPMQVRNVKLEVGNTATDWSPAPEDVDSAISDAAKTATSYVTEITGQNGIMVHPSTDDDTGVRITSDVDILRDGYSVINVGTQGDTSGNTDAGVTIYDGNGNAAENVRARFGTTIRLGSDEYPMLDIRDGWMYFYPTADDVQSLYFGPTTRIQRLLNGSLKLQSDNGAVSLYGQTIGVTPANGSNTFSTAPSTVLWSGAYYMTSNHTATLKYSVSTCPTGIVLHFQPYGSTAQNYFHQYCFVPKTAVSDYSGSVHNFTLCNSGFAKVGMKALRIYDDRIVGDDTNDDTGAASGITFDNKYWVMTQVIAV